MLWTITEPCSNREFPQGDQRNYHSLIATNEHVRYEVAQIVLLPVSRGHRLVSVQMASGFRPPASKNTAGQGYGDIERNLTISIEGSPDSRKQTRSKGRRSQKAHPNLKIGLTRQAEVTETLKEPRKSEALDFQLHFSINLRFHRPHHLPDSHGWQVRRGPRAFLRHTFLHRSCCSASGDRC